MTAPATPHEFVNAIRDAFELVEAEPGRVYLHFPFRFRSGDWLPIAVERRGDGLALSDDGLLQLEMANYTRKDIYHGRMLGTAVASVLHRHDATLDGGTIRRSLGGDDPAAAFADFVEALLSIEDLALGAEERAPSIWARRPARRAAS